MPVMEDVGNIANAISGLTQAPMQSLFDLAGASKPSLDPFSTQGNWWIGNQGVSAIAQAGPKVVPPPQAQRVDLGGGTASLGSRVVSAAAHQLGVNYVWGGETPSGFDCSGLVWWALNHAGIKVPRTTAQGYMNMAKVVPKQQLQPGDLIFFNFAGGSGAEHIGIYAGNGQYIDAPHTGAQVRKESIPWSDVVFTGRIGNIGRTSKGSVPGFSKPVPVARPSAPKLDPALAGASAMGSPVGLGDVMTSMLTPPAQHQTAGAGSTGQFTGPHAQTEQQLYKGFMDAGRPDLARMVGTAAFTTWIGQESGWRVNAQSAANNQGLANGGLFQFWYGHNFTDPYQGSGSFTANAYQQALMVARNFHLTAADISRYAREIHNGSYQGWS